MHHWRLIRQCFFCAGPTGAIIPAAAVCSNQRVADRDGPTGGMTDRHRPVSGAPIRRWGISTARSRASCRCASPQRARPALSQATPARMSSAFPIALPDTGRTDLSARRGRPVRFGCRFHACLLQHKHARPRRQKFVAAEQRNASRAARRDKSPYCREPIGSHEIGRESRFL